MRAHLWSGRRSGLLALAAAGCAALLTLASPLPASASQPAVTVTPINSTAPDAAKVLESYVSLVRPPSGERRPAPGGVRSHRLSALPRPPTARATRPRRTRSSWPSRASSRARARSTRSRATQSRTRRPRASRRVLGHQPALELPRGRLRGARLPRRRTTRSVALDYYFDGATHQGPQVRRLRERAGRRLALARRPRADGAGRVHGHQPASTGGAPGEGVLRRPLARRARHGGVRQLGLLRHGRSGRGRVRTSVPATSRSTRGSRSPRAARCCATQLGGLVNGVLVAP